MIRHVLVAILTLFLFQGCADKPEHADEEAALAPESFYDENLGLRLPEETRTSIGVELIEIESESPAIPQTAIIGGIEEDFVFVESKGHFIRAVVTTAASSNGSAVISQGLRPGDKLVVKGADELRMIELLAVRGGTACCEVPARKPED